MDSIRIRNLRSLTDTEDIQIKPLTILVGKNSSGKSTFLRFFPLMKQTLSTKKNEPILWYSKENVDFGSFDAFKVIADAHIKLETVCTSQAEFL